MDVVLYFIEGYMKGYRFWPEDFKFAKEMAEEAGLTEERLLELTTLQLMPHFMIDKTTPVFDPRDVKNWVAANLLEKASVEAMPLHIQVISNGINEIENDPFCLPSSIADLAGLVYKVSGAGSPGVYFLCRERKVVYVGQSQNVYDRIKSHEGNKKKDFDRAYALPVPNRYLRLIEGAFIRLLQPLYNDKNTPAPDPSFPDEKILQSYGISQAS